MLTPVEFGSFGGLNLQADPQNVSGGGAIDTLDVDFDVRGGVRARDGYTKFSASAGTVKALNLSAVGLRLFASENGTGKYRAFYTDGTATLSAAIAGGATSGFVGFGNTASSVTYAYAGTGTATNTITRWQEGVGFTYPATGYGGAWAAVQAPDNRLVLISANDSAGVGYRVRFSNAGAPETFSANDYVDLTPNDGDTITGTATYDNKIFVFKQKKFFVFYGNSVDGSGNAVFNYRMVDTGKGCYIGACTASPEGVYFHAKDGIYLTTGGPPVKVSQPLDVLFRGHVPSTYSGSYLNLTTILYSAYSKMCWFNDRLYFSSATGSGSAQDRLFVLDKELGWLVWSIPVSGLATWYAPSGTPMQEALYFSYASGTFDVGYLNPAATTDGGSAISAKWRSGFWNPAQPAAESVIREWLLDGSGTVNFKTSVNDGSLGSAASLTLGTSPAVAQSRDRRAVRGRNVSFEISGTAPWSVSRVVANMRGQRNAGLKAT